MKKFLQLTLIGMVISILTVALLHAASPLELVKLNTAPAQPASVQNGTAAPSSILPSVSSKAPATPVAGSVTPAPGTPKAAMGSIPYVNEETPVYDINGHLMPETETAGTDANETEASDRQAAPALKAMADIPEYDINNPAIWIWNQDEYAYAIDLKGNQTRISLGQINDLFPGYYDLKNKEFKHYKTTVTFMPQFQQTRVSTTLSTYSLRQKFTLINKTWFAALPAKSVQDLEGNRWGCVYTKFDVDKQKWNTLKFRKVSNTSSDDSDYKDFRDMEREYSLVAVDHLSNIWALAYDGKLYKINKETGEESDFIQTELYPRGKGCTGYIDRNTDKLYVCCIDKESGDNSKFYLFEVDIHTGAAKKINTLISQDYFHIFNIPFIAWHEAPDYPSNVSFSIEPDALAGKVNFTMPSKTFGGEPLSGNLKYTVTANGKTLTTGTSAAGTAVSAGIRLDSVGKYEIKVFASNDKGDGAKYSCERFIGAYTAPHAELFPNDSSINRCMTIDANGDGMTWFNHNKKNENITFRNSLTYKPLSMGYYGIDCSDQDDYLILPPVKLEKGKAYKATLSAHCSPNSPLPKPELLIAPASDNLKASDFTQTVIEPFAVQTPEEVWREHAAYDEEEFLAGKDSAINYFAVSETGVYNLAVRDKSNEGEHILILCDVSVSAPSSPDVPGLPENASIAPAYDGSTKAIISFEAPTKTIVGAPLPALSKIEVVRDSVVIKSLSNPAPGQKISLEDILAEAGDHTYKIQAYTQQGLGRVFRKSLYIGANEVIPVENIVMKETENLGEVSISWEHSNKTVEGFDIDPAQIHYQIIDATKSGFPVLADSIRTKSATIRINDGAGIQSLTAVGIYAVTAKGKSVPVTTKLLPVGKPEVAPYYESFKSAKLSHPMGMESLMYGAVWRLYEDYNLNNLTSSDNDNGFTAQLGSYYDASAQLFTAKIDLSRLKKPVVGFSTYNYQENEYSPNLNRICVVARPIGTADAPWETVFDEAIDSICSNEINTWARIIVSLEKYKGKTVQIGFKGVHKSYAQTLLDDIRIEEAIGKDMALKTITAKPEVDVNEDFNISVGIFNKASEKAARYKVTLFKNGSLFKTIEGTDLRAGGYTDVVFTDNINVTEPETVRYRAVVELDGDEDISDNASSEIEVKSDRSSLPAPTALSGNAQSGEGVDLSWNAPEESKYAETVTETFEDYTPWQYDKTFGDWTTIDVDKAPVWGVSGLSFTMPNFTFEKTLNSFWIFEVEPDVFSADDRRFFAAHSGMKYATSFYNHASASDDWMITPELSGRNQTIRLFAKSYHNTRLESIEFLYSTTDKEPASFIRAEEVKAVPQPWTQYEIEIPEGAKYFAIRKVTPADKGGFFMVDDVTYEPKGSREMVNEVLGYNVYRDGRRVNDKPVGTTSWRDTGAPEGDHEYCVSAIYTGEESQPSARITVRMSGLTEISAGTTVTAGRGFIEIRGAAGAKAEVSSLSGIMMHSCAVKDDVMRISMAAGVYFVSINGNSYKVIVK